MLPFGRLLHTYQGWSYRVEDDQDPYDGTVKKTHCMVDPKGVHHWEFDELCSPYEIASDKMIEDFVAYKSFQRGRAT